MLSYLKNISRQDFQVTVLWVGLFVAMGLMGFALWSSFSAQEEFRDRSTREFKVQELCNDLLYLNEAMYKSVILYMETKADSSWQRYEKLDAKLVSKLEELLNESQNIYYTEVVQQAQETAAQIRNKNNDINETVKKRRLNKARNILFGENYQEMRRSFIENIEHFGLYDNEALRLAILHGKIIYLDESLTMALRLITYTGDEMWWREYQNDGVRMDRTFREFISLIDSDPIDTDMDGVPDYQDLDSNNDGIIDAAEDSIPKNDSLNKTRSTFNPTDWNKDFVTQKIISIDESIAKMEIAILKLGFNGKRKEAENLLNSEKYRTLKKEYAECLLALKDKITFRSREERKKNLRPYLLRFYIAALLLLVIFIFAANILRLRRQLVRRNEILNRKNQELEQFAYIVSHDLKSPLRVISGLTTLLERNEKKNLSAKGKEDFDLIRNQSVQLYNMIQGILEMSRIDKKKDLAETVNLNEILKDIKTLYATDDKLTFYLPKNQITINTYRTGITQVLHNLVSNSIKHNKDKYRLIIKVGAERKNGVWRIVLEDNGKGINPEYHERIFGLFETLEGKTEENTGVGLAIVKKYVGEMGGEIKVDAKFTKGARFILTLPEKLDSPLLEK